jgi:hypothetical protein
MTTIAIVIIQIIVGTTLFMLGSYYGYEQRKSEERDDKADALRLSEATKEWAESVKKKNMAAYKKQVAKNKKTKKTKL